MTNSAFSISIPRDFHYGHTLAYLTRSKDELLHSVEEESIYKLVEFDQKKWFLEIALTEKGRLDITVLNGKPDASQKNRIETFIRHWFDLDRDLTPFYQLSENDPLLAPIVERFRGLRIIGVEDLFEALCWSVLGQQVNLAFAYTLKRRVVETFGEKSSWDGRNFWLFPEVERVANLEKEDLRALSITNRKAEYMIGIARLMVEGHLSKEKLLQPGDWKAAEKDLVSIRGIGPWAAHYVIMRCLRFTQAFPVADIGLKNAVKNQIGMDRKPTDQELFSLAENWKGWESYATFYLWQSLSG